MVKNNLAPDKNIQEQTDKLTSQTILKQINNLCDNLTRQFTDAMEYQSDPVRVIPAEDVHKAVCVITKFPEKYQASIDTIKSDVKSSMDEIHLMNSNYSVLSSAYSKLSEDRKLLEAEVKKLNEEKSDLKKQIEVLNTDRWDRFVRNAKRHLKQCFSADSIFKGVICMGIVMLVLIAYFMIETFYLSADSLARRAYDAATDMQWKNPGMYYQEIRVECRENGKKSGRQLVEYYESFAEEKKLETGK